MDFLTLKHETFVLNDQGVDFLSDVKDIPGCDYIHTLSSGSKVRFSARLSQVFCVKWGTDDQFLIVNKQELEYFFEEKCVFYIYLKHGTIDGGTSAMEEKYMDLHVPKS